MSVEETMKKYHDEVRSRTDPGSWKERRKEGRSTALFAGRLYQCLGLALVALLAPACESSTDHAADPGTGGNGGHGTGGAADGGTAGARMDGGTGGAHAGSGGADGGAGGRADAGAGTGGASAGDAGASHQSAGCGMAATGTSSYVRQTLTIRNVAREFFLWIPRTYSATHAYPIIFRWHGTGGNGTSGGLEIEAASGEQAIIASPSGVGGVWDLTSGGADVELFDTVLAQLEGRYCVDTDRVFSYGFSAGAGFTNLLACVRGADLRAVAPVEGWAPQTTGCEGKIAAWITHSVDDTTVTIDRGAASRDLFRGFDGCGTTTAAVTPSPCIRYQGCMTGYPVDWCQTTGPHDPQGAFTGPGAWGFFNSLP
jgi:poly(3-hydroxybutyrate) depolymerase